MSGRFVSEQRAQKLSLIQQIAEKRKAAGFKHTILGLSDSDSEDDQWFEQQQNQTQNTAPSIATSRSNSTNVDYLASMKRLQKKTGSSESRPPVGTAPAPAASVGAGPSKGGQSTQERQFAEADDLISQLQGLNLEQKLKSTAQPPPRPPPEVPRPQSRPQPPSFPTAPPHLPPPVDSDAQATTDQGGELVLGNNQEFKLSSKLSTTLYPHQVTGVTWLWGLHQVGAGGILADDMGLGKTMQVSAFLAGLLVNKLIKRAIIVAPKTLLAHWSKEISLCGVASSTHEYFGTKAERDRSLSTVMHKGGIILTTYGMVQHNADVLATWKGHDADEGSLWDVMILDEGHKLKNPKMLLREKLESIPVRMRVIISGTPIQNNLGEMHALFDFVCPDLLGDAKLFKDMYECRITAGNDKHATVGERERGAAAAAHLRQTIAPYMLRREKKDVFKSREAAETSVSGSDAVTGGKVDQAAALQDGTVSDTTSSSSGNSSAPMTMGHKNDFVVWLRLQPTQRQLYEAFLDSDAVKSVLNQTSSALAALTVLKKICDHPALLSERAQQGIVTGAHRAARKMQGEGSDSDAISDEEDEESQAQKKETQLERTKSTSSNTSQGFVIPKKNVGLDLSAQLEEKRQKQLASMSGGSGADLSWATSGSEASILSQMHTSGFEASCKTVFVMSLLHQLVKEGHRTLVFSQSRVMLNILEAAVRAEGWPMCRIDGSVASAEERQNRVQAFQTNPNIPVFLLTSQVGGLGLTLTAASRVIIVDPAWNPSTDNQSVDRAYRIGQQRDVIVYRLISCGTVEEKIYRKQVFKGGLSRTGTEDGEQFRYFSQQDLRDLFRIDHREVMSSVTQKQLHSLHAHQRRETPELRQHLEFLKMLEGFAGVSDHDLLYTKKEVEGSSKVPFGQNPPTAAGGFTSPTRRPKSNVAKGGQEWSGSSDISAMFSKVLTLGGGSEGPGLGPSSNSTSINANNPMSQYLLPTALTRPSGPAAAAAGDQGAGGDVYYEDDDAKQLQIDAIKAQIRKQSQLMYNPVLISSLADGGAKIKAKISALEAELRQLQSDNDGGHATAIQQSPPAALPPVPELKVESNDDEMEEGELVFDERMLLSLPEAHAEPAVVEQPNVQPAAGVSAVSPSPERYIAPPPLPPPSLPRQVKQEPTTVHQIKKEVPVPSSPGASAPIYLEKEVGEASPFMSPRQHQSPAASSQISVPTAAIKATTPLGRLGATLFGLASSALGWDTASKAPRALEEEEVGGSPAAPAMPKPTWREVVDSLPSASDVTELRSDFSALENYWSVRFSFCPPLAVDAAQLEEFEARLAGDRQAIKAAKKEMHHAVQQLKQLQDIIILSSLGGKYVEREEVERKQVEEQAGRYYQQRAELARNEALASFWKENMS